MISLEKLRVLTFRSVLLAKHASTLVPKETNFLDKFSKDEQNRVLEIVNKSNSTELSRLKLPSNRIKCLQSWKTKMGPFKDLPQLLEVDGLEVTNLEKLCQRILADNEGIQRIKKNSLSKRQYIWPAFTTEAANNLNTALGIHVDSTGMSWTKICKTDKHITDWDFYSFSQLPTKMLPIDNFNLATTVLSILPASNVYIFELQPTKNSKSSQTFMQLLELNSMLYALINTSITHNVDEVSNSNKNMSRNRIYHIRNSLPARLFKTLVGGEKVSTMDTVARLFNQDENLPCENIVIGNSLVDQYQTVPKESKELLGQALLLTITFMELIVNKNPESYKAIQPRQK